jgi:peptide deformylase
MELLKFPHPALFKVCKEVTVFGDELKVLLQGMWEVMNKGNGIGLASNQVGLEYRMFVMMGPFREQLFLINPTIIRRSEAPANISEGCLSAPGEFILLAERMFWTQVQFQDEKGKSHTRVFQGLHSVCVQHEIDHLDGKSHLMSKSISKAHRKVLYKKWGLK